jgi:hypothetical protein
MAWAEDRALLGSTPSAVLGAKTEAGAESTARPFSSSYCQMLWIGFDSGGVIYLDPVDEFGS